MPPLTIVAGRLAIGGVLLLAISLIAGRGLPPRTALPLLAALAVLNNVIPFSLIIWAQQHIDSSMAATLNSIMPLFTFMIAVGVGSERPDGERAAGVVIGFVGAAVLIGPDLGDVTSSSMVGNLAVIAGSLSYACAAVLARQRLHGDPLVLASGQLLLGALIAAPLALAVDGFVDLSISAKAAWSWLALGAGPSGLAFIIFYWLVQRVSATNVALVSYIIPVVAAVLGWLVLDERIGPNLFIGLILIIVGMAAVNGNLRWLARRRRPTPAGAHGG